MSEIRYNMHGLNVGIERHDEQFFLNMKIIGKLTHADYEVINPMLDAAMEGIKHPEIKALVDLTEMEGWELRAAWDDMKLGLKHGNEFRKIALYGNKKWQEFAIKIGGWFINGDAKYFDDKTAALGWLIEEA